MTFDELLNEIDQEDQDDLAEGDEQRLRRVFDAAVTFVERIHKGRFNFTGEPSSRPLPGEDLKLGTVMLARRWDTRRRSPGGLVAMAELGAARVPSFDADIDRLLRIGRHAIPRVG
ncbi:hypothetical protein ACIRG5_42345 [Lentzea sp. NPDC102401]|uniref:hypothetical protein n=1 Tax=Lentzea sp. NPDC102401 TaxID=3364128 RepID=UPI0037F1A7E9